MRFRHSCCSALHMRFSKLGAARAGRGPVACGAKADRLALRCLPPLPGRAAARRLGPAGMHRADCMQGGPRPGPDTGPRLLATGKDVEGAPVGARGRPTEAVQPAPWHAVRPGRVCSALRRAETGAATARPGHPRRRRWPRSVGLSRRRGPVAGLPATSAAGGAGARLRRIGPLRPLPGPVAPPLFTIGREVAVFAASRRVGYRRSEGFGNEF